MQHCKKHKQDYMDYLRECPVCGGERYARENPPVRLQYDRRKKMSNSKITGVVGLDLSLTSTGFARIEAQPSGNFKHMAITTSAGQFPTQTDRLVYVAQTVMENSEKTDVFFIEDYAFGARKGENSLANLGELGGVLKLFLSRFCPWHPFTVAISMWKQFLCNKGNLNKDEFKMQVFKKFNIEAKTNDEAAAIAIADFGYCILRGSSTERELTKYEQEKIKKYKDIHLKELQALALLARQK